MRKLGIGILLGMVLIAVNSCNTKRPFACYTTDVSPDSIYVGQPVTFTATCSSNGNDYFWEFYDNDDSTVFGYSVTMTFYQPGNVDVFLLVSNNSSTSSTSDVIKVKP